MAHTEAITELQLTGGEALIREDIWEIISYAHTRGLVVLLQTNGVIGSPVMEKLQALDPKLTRIIVSIDGIETNGALRGASVTDNAIRTVKTLSARFPVRINTLLTARIGDEEIDRLIKLATQTGAEIAFNPMIPRGRGNISDMADPKEFFERMVWIEKAGSNIRKGFTYDAQTRQFQDNENCPVRRGDSLFVASNGDCYPCGFLDGYVELRMGNMLRQNGGFAAIKRNTPAGCCDVSTECAACAHYINKHCFAGCPARIYALHAHFEGCEFYCMKKHGGEWM